MPPFGSVDHFLHAGRDFGHWHGIVHSRGVYVKKRLFWNFPRLFKINRDSCRSISVGERYVVTHQHKEYQRMIHKITSGFVVQKFENNKFVSQEFIAGDQVEYETPNGEQVEEEEVENLPYQPFDMVQPTNE